MIFTETSQGWTEDFWGKWNAFLKTQAPSVFLDARSVRAALNVHQRRVKAVAWLDSDPESKISQIIGIAVVEDTAAVSQTRGKSLKADKPVFKLAQTYLYRNDGKFRLNIRVLGSVLSSGDHAYRFASNISKDEVLSKIDEALTHESEAFISSPWRRVVIMNVVK